MNLMLNIDENIIQIIKQNCEYICKRKGKIKVDAPGGAIKYKFIKLSKNLANI